ncbi:hypothetical protein BU16DRAFT_543336 [Lophium mytilinum]|uniref:Uncharacterized protein n=1 Tax=Lophium mytilinum TaxID=390894 RepID=A0A6A6QF98_9PEZI|nr:hypothetical protein BU16DRAFT_543336 [Lophium mytilinum]
MRYDERTRPHKAICAYCSRSLASSVLEIVTACLKCGTAHYIEPHERSDSRKSLCRVCGNHLPPTFKDDSVVSQAVELDWVRCLNCGGIHHLRSEERRQPHLAVCGFCNKHLGPSVKEHMLAEHSRHLQSVQCFNCKYTHYFSRDEQAQPHKANCGYCGQSLSRSVEEALIGVGSAIGGALVTALAMLFAAANAISGAL